MGVIAACFWFESFPHRSIVRYRAGSTESEKVAMIRTARDSVFIGIYDFFFAPSSESLFISLLRSTGVHALAGGGLERKETVSGRRRITGHLQGTRESFTQMESMLRDHGVEAVRNSLFAG